MANFITGIISLTIGVVILANVFIFTVKNTSTCVHMNATGYCNEPWGAGEVAMWGLITLVAVVGMVYGVLNVFGLS